MIEKGGVNINTYAIKGFLLNFLVPLIALGLSGLLGFLVIYPSVKSMPALAKEVKDKQTLESQLSSKLENLNNLSEFQSVVDENSALVQKVLVDEALVPQLLTQIDQIAKESGLEIAKLNYSFSETQTPVATATGQPVVPEVPQAPYKTVDVSVGTTGNFDQVITFLKNLERAARLIDVESFRYTADQKDSNLLDANFSLVSPYLKIESNAVTDDPVSLTLSDSNFVQFINTIRELKYYDISSENVNTEVVDLAEPSESTPSETTEETTEETAEQPNPALP